MRPEVNSHQSHFLEACFLCQKPLGHNSDIFMYRGNTPFCSQECREEQIEIDEAKERRWKGSLRQTTTKKSESNSKKQPSSASSPGKAVRTSTVAVA